MGPQPPQITGQVQAPVDFQAVRVYLPRCKLAQYETVAKLDASKLGVNSSFQFNVHWIKQLSKQAAGLGANGLLLIPIGSEATTGYANHGPAFEATAIRVSPANAPTAGSPGQAQSCVLHIAKLLHYEVYHFASTHHSITVSEPRK